MSTDLTTFSPSTPTMSSLEIATLVGKRHDNVKRTIETIAAQGVIVHPQIEDVQESDSMGRPRTTKVYIFSGEQGKRDSIVVVAQLSPEFTGRLVDRWQELESGQSTRIVIHDTQIKALVFALQEVDTLKEQQRIQAIKLSEQAERMRAIEARQDAELYGCRYFSVIAYANLAKVRIDLTTAARIGKLATKMCLAQGVTIGKVYDQRYGTVGTYPEEILKDVFTDLERSA